MAVAPAWAVLPLPTGATPAANTADTAAAFPKRMTARGVTFGAWNSGFVYPNFARTGYYGITSVTGSNDTSIGGLLEFDGAGNTTRRISPLQLGVDLLTTNDSSRFFAQQTLGTEVTFGLYSSTAPYTPIFQNKLTSNPAKTVVVPSYDQNRLYMIRDLGANVEVIAFNANGGVTWARRYSSVSFGTTLPTDTQVVFGIPLADGGLLLQVLRFTIDLTTFSAGYDTTLSKLNASGGVEWSRKPSGNAFFAAIPSQLSTSLFLTGTELPALGSQTIPGTFVAKLTSTGTLVWAKRISGGTTVSGLGELSGDKFLLQGATASLQGIATASVLGVLGSTGALEAQTQFSFATVNAASVQTEAGRIWIGLTAGSSGTEARPAYVGLADATLANIRWKKYKNNMNSVVVSPDYDSDDVAVSLFHDADRALEVATFKDDFAASASATLFTDASPTLSNPGLVVSDVSLALTSAIITDVAFAPTLLASTPLTFETMTTTETSTGAGTGGGPDPIAVTIALQPTAQTVTSGSSASFTVALNNPSALSVTYAWRLNGIAIAGANAATYSIPSAQPGNVGLYSVAVTSNGVTLVTTPVALGITPTSRPLGNAVLFAGDIVHPTTQNVYDQFLLTGTSATITADPGQIARISFIDLNDDIVQLEYSGAGTLTIALTNASGPAVAVNYNQPTVSYMKGHATVTITGANATTNFGIYSVGAATGNVAVLKPGTVYDGFADVALVNFTSTSGQFGGVRIGNASFFAVSGNTGIFAPGVNFAGPMNLYDIDARENAFPKLVTGTVGTNILITGGNLLQTNGRAIEFGNAAIVRMNPGTRSDGTFLPAQVNLGRLERNGVDVTASVIVGP